jgi:peroxiredoxin
MRKPPLRSLSSRRALSALCVPLMILAASLGAPQRASHASPKEGSASAALTIGQPAPDFTLKDHTGATHTLSSYRGKLVVLEWTNPGCPFVVRHSKAKTMSKLKEAFPDVVWLTINSSYFNTDSDSAAWAQREGVKAVLNDSAGQVGRLYNARTTPHMYVINTKGELAYQGAIDDDPYGDQKEPLNYVSEALKALKAAQAPKVSETKPYGCSVKYKR